MRRSTILLAVGIAVVAPRAAAAQGVVRGVVYDSLLHAPLAGATVRVAGAGVASLTDDSGAYELTGVPAGRHAFEVFHPELEPLGLQGVFAQAEVTPGRVTTLALATPSLGTIKAGRCDDAARVLRVAVFDAASLRPVAGAAVVVRWTEVRPARAGDAVVSRPTLRDSTDATGTVATCIPPGVEPVASVDAGGVQSATLEVTTGARRMGGLTFMLDLAGRHEATADVAVHDTRGRPVHGAVVSVAGHGSGAATDEAGRAVLRGMPGGTQVIEVRRLGMAAQRVRAELIPGGTTSLGVTLDDAAQQLAPVHVQAERTAMRREFDFRRQTAGGFAFTPEQMKAREHIPMEQLIRSLPGVRVERRAPHLPTEVTQDFDVYQPGDLMVKLPGTYGWCIANLYLDDARIHPNTLLTLPAREIAAIELFPRPAVAPPRQAKLGNGCGVIMFWTRHAFAEPEG